MLTHHHPEPRNPRRVVVVGAGGFVGRRLLASLQTDGVPIAAITRSDIDLGAGSAGAALADRLRADDALVFLAALTPDKGRGPQPFQTNIAMGAAVAQAIEKAPVAHVVYFSSDAVYPLDHGLTNERSPAEPVDLYGAMHAAREIMIAAATRAPVALLRPTLIYGAGDTHNSYGPNRFIRSARRDGKITIFGQGEETRDHISVDDVVTLTRLVLANRSAGLLNLATGHSISYGDLARKVAALSRDSVRIDPSPRQSAITHRHFDVTAIRHAFPRFVPTPIDDGLARAWRDWPERGADVG